MSLTPLANLLLVILPYFIPDPHLMPRRQKSSGKGKQRGQGIDRQIAQSSQVVGRNVVQLPSADFTRPVPSFLLTQVPRSLRNQIHWIQTKINVVTTISNSVPTENNFAFHLSDYPNTSGLAAFFDQYCIYSVSVSITPSFEGAGSTLYTFGTCATAIDYDNIANLASLDAVLAFNSCVVSEMSPGTSIQRYLKPCVAPALYTTGASLAGYSVQRMWVDSANTGVPHYGFRTYFVNNSVSGLSVAIDLNVVFGFRNSI